MGSSEFEDAGGDERGQPESWSAQLDRIDDLIADASTRQDLEDRIKSLEEALSLACRFLTRINRRIKRFIRKAVEDSPTGEQHITVPLSDVARSHPELAMFQDWDSLEDVFATINDLLVKQGYLDRERAELIREQSKNSFNEMVESKIGFDEFLANFETLKRFCCDQPPGSFGVGPDDEPPPGPEGNETRSQKVSRYLDNLASLATIGALLAPLIWTEPAKPPPPQKPPIEYPLELRLLVLLLLSVQARRLSADGIVPAEERPVPALVGAGSGATSGMMTA
jgi:hypothetical protein